MGSNKRAFVILNILVLAAVAIFLLEQKFLVTESRGSTLSHYEAVKDIDKILLLIEDFEDLSQADSVLVGDSVLKSIGFFSFGNAKISMDHSSVDNAPIASKSALKVEWTGTEAYGGFGRGVGANISLNALTDHINFRIYFPKSNGQDEKLQIILEEDDNENGTLEKDQDDIWFSKVNIPAMDKWQIISLPLKNFTDQNEGGDHILNVTRKGGLHNIIFAFDQPDKYTEGQKWYFDFICISSEFLAENETLK